MSGWVDVTAAVLGASPPASGAAVLDSSVLDEAVAAIDVLSPRMDRGMLRVGGRTLAEHLLHVERDVLPTAPLFSDLCIGSGCEGRSSVVSGQPGGDLVSGSDGDGASSNIDGETARKLSNMDINGDVNDSSSAERSNCTLKVIPGDAPGQFICHWYFSSPSHDKPFKVNSDKPSITFKQAPSPDFYWKNRISLFSWAQDAVRTLRQEIVNITRECSRQSSSTLDACAHNEMSRRCMLNDSMRLDIVGIVQDRVRAWFAGAAFVDCLSPLAALHFVDRVACPVLRWMLCAVLRSARLFADAAHASGVVTHDEFQPRIHGISAMLIGGHAAVVAEWERDISVCVGRDHSLELAAEARRIFAWLCFTRDLVENPTDFDLRWSEERVASVFGAKRACASDRSAILRDWLLEEPLLANLYGAGCVRVPYDGSKEVALAYEWAHLGIILSHTLNDLQTCGADAERIILHVLEVSPFFFGLSLGTVVRVFHALRATAQMNRSHTREIDLSAATDGIARQIVHVLLHDAPRQHRMLARLLPLLDTPGMSLRVLCVLALHYAGLLARLELYEPYERPEALAITVGLAAGGGFYFIGRHGGLGLLALCAGYEMVTTGVAAPLTSRELVTNGALSAFFDAFRQTSNEQTVIERTIESKSSDCTATPHSVEMQLWRSDEMQRIVSDAQERGRLGHRWGPIWSILARCVPGLDSDIAAGIRSIAALVCTPERVARAVQQCALAEPRDRSSTEFVCNASNLADRFASSACPILREVLKDRDACCGSRGRCSALFPQLCGAPLSHSVEEQWRVILAKMDEHSFARGFCL